MKIEYIWGEVQDVKRLLDYLLVFSELISVDSGYKISITTENDETGEIETYEEESSETTFYNFSNREANVKLYIDDGYAEVEIVEDAEDVIRRYIDFFKGQIELQIKCRVVQGNRLVKDLIEVFGLKSLRKYERYNTLTTLRVRIDKERFYDLLDFFRCRGL